MGVTGTLKTLSKSEKNIVEGVYNIKKSTFMPSVFGVNKRQFAKEADVYIENKENYFIRLREKIDYALGAKKSKRAVLVFFESKISLMEFYNSKNLETLKSNVQIITEEVSSSPTEKDMLIKRATKSGQVTLLTRIFGRGTDFVCRDQTVISNGGVHVIQTFFSEELSEEIQIMGRTARQGKDGSYGMVLLDSSLEKFLGTSYLAVIEMMRKNAFTYDTLHSKRIEFFDTKYSDIDQYVKNAEKEHKLGREFIESLNENRIDFLKSFLKDRNKGSLGTYDSRTICLIDATGSMYHLLNQAKNTVQTMFERASIILKDNGIPENSFQMQFAVYRDYDAPVDKILESSPWETNSDNLKMFLERIAPSFGGNDYPEAIEIALWHANNEHKKAPISQVILIGDAPAKSMEAIEKSRELYNGKEYWSKSIFKDVTDFHKELKKLKDNEIPVHAFYLYSGAKQNFEYIASETGGKSMSLIGFSKDGSNTLTNIVTETILGNVGQLRGKSDELVQAYRKKFGTIHL